MHKRNNYPPVGGWTAAQHTRPRQEHDEQVEREAMAHRIDRERDMALISGMTENELEVMRMQADAMNRDITEYAKFVMLHGGRGTGKNIDFRQAAIGEMIQFLQRNGYKVTKSKRG